jgi:hypothetical protein
MKELMRQIWFVLTIRCDAASLLLSDELDRPLTRCEKLAIRLHEISCRNCHRFRKQLALIQAAALEAETEPATLSEASRTRIRENLKKEKKNL